MGRTCMIAKVRLRCKILRMQEEMRGEEAREEDRMRQSKTRELTGCLSHSQESHGHDEHPQAERGQMAARSEPSVAHTCLRWS